MEHILPIGTVEEVTDQWIQAIIRQHLNMEVHVENIKKKQNNTRHGFLSEILFIDVTFREMETLSLVLKVAPIDEGMKSLVVNSSLAQAEVSFYKSMNSCDFKDNLTALGIIPPIPTVLYCEIVNQVFTIVMEDLSAGDLKYQSPKAGDNADLSLTKQVIEAIAAMHAICYAYIERYGITSLGAIDKTNGIDDVTMGKLFKNGLELALDKTKISNKEILDSLQRLISNGDYSQFLKPLEDKLPCTIIHGDYWIAQVMFNKLKQKVLVLDWQFAQLCSPAYDIVTFMAMSSQIPVYRDNLNEVVQAYVTKLNEYLLKLKCSVNITPDQMITSVNNAWHKGFLMLFVSLSALFEIEFIEIDKLDDFIMFGYENNFFQVKPVL